MAFPLRSTLSSLVTKKIDIHIQHLQHAASNLYAFRARSKHDRLCGVYRYRYEQVGSLLVRIPRGIGQVGRRPAGSAADWCKCCIIVHAPRIARTVKLIILGGSLLI
jgi:hypothetical protein